LEVYLCRGGEGREGKGGEGREGGILFPSFSTLNLKSLPLLISDKSLIII